MPKQARALRTYDRVLDAAAYEFARYGYANANLQNMADRVRLTKGALYGHFSTKEDLAVALDNHLSGALEGLLAEARVLPHTPPIRLRSLVLGLGRLFGRDERALAALRLSAETARSSARPIPLLAEAHGLVVHLVGETQKAGHWSDSVPTAPLADLIMAALLGMFLTETGPDFDHGRAGAEAADAVHAMWEALSQALDATSAH
ncbi:TetR/AcrR family transcriptional regulator [Streptomyces genisteinicus]|uniref:TetR/AcrR family transcriptional regulator n=1 Tax=Streptomyces genisteinicus TaxID=2768068 RepID=A0A7H0HZL9_9ACTN|nr:TetR/AcrR family transcriptional regulator [Streptomyces genisteinicus]QNP65985.1 TetR/AcrR family transcriptional regulator [Streptomyces genisteinicus]